MKIETKNTEQKIAFFDKPQNVTWMLRVFYVICILLVAADFVVHRHINLSFEKIPAFYALYGFIACVVLVFAATAMRKLVMRDEHYYDKREDEASQVVLSESSNDADADSVSADDVEHQSTDKESH